MLAAIAVGVLAVILRSLWLDRLGLHLDEDISSLAARGIARSAFPALPSGHLYWRAPLYHYLLVPFVWSGVDWVPRILSVILSALTGVLLVRHGGALVGGRAARLGGFLFALSLVEISLARQIRMYSLYQPLALAAVFLIHRFWTTGELRWGWLSALVILLALSAHELAATLALLYLPVAIRHPTVRVWTFSLAAVAFFGLLLKVYGSLIGRSLHGGLPTVAEPPGPVTEAALRAPFRMMLAGDPLAFVRHTLGTEGMVALLACVTLLGGGLGFASTRGIPPSLRVVAGAGLAAVLAAAGGGQLGLAVALLVLLALHRTELFPGRAGARALLAAGAAAALIAIGWFAAALAAGHAWVDILLGMTRWPLRLSRMLLWPPAIAAAAIAGAAVIAARAWRGRDAGSARFLLVAVGWLVVSRGVLGDRIQIRYLAEVWPLWELLAAWSVMVLLERYSRGDAPPRRRLAPVLAVGMAVAAAFLPGTAPRDLVAFLSRSPGSRPAVASRLDTAAADLRGAGAWLAPRLQPGDLVVATDWLTTRCYLPRVDGWLRSKDYGWQSVRVDGVVRDCYLGAEVIPDLAALVEFARPRPVWVVAGGQELVGAGGLLSPQIAGWLLGRAPSFVAADGQTRVYRLGPPGR